MLSIKADKREIIGKKVSKLRKEGFVPAVLYGKKEASVAITVPLKDFERIWKEAGESTVIEITGLGDEKEALIHDVDVEPVYGSIRHVDFYAIEKGKKVRVAVPLSFIGVAPAEKELGGTLVKVLHELEIESLPKDLPQEIEVDISSLIDFETQIHAKDIKLPERVILMADAEEVVALVQEAKEEEEEPEEAPDLDSIEVEEKGKKEEEIPEEEEKE